MARSLTLRAETDLTEISARYENSFDEALAELEERGIFVSTTPPSLQDFNGAVPSNLSDMDSRDIGDLLGKAKTWAGYVSGLLALQDGARTADMEALRAAESASRKRMIDAGTKKYEKDDVTRLDVRVVELREKWLKAEISYKILKAVYDNAQDTYAAVSREISRRELDQSQGTRLGNVLNRRHGRTRAHGDG